MVKYEEQIPLPDDVERRDEEGLFEERPQAIEYYEDDQVPAEEE